MAKIGKYAVLNGKIIPFEEANLSIASSAVLYGLSVYTVFCIKYTEQELLAFRIDDHLTRLKISSEVIGLDDVTELVNKEKFLKTVSELMSANNPSTDQCVRVTIHAKKLLPGVRTKDVELAMSIFSYDAEPILPPTGARVKIGTWRRVPDIAIPPRAKVNGAYINSALAKQEAINGGYDDCLFLNLDGHISELSAANIFFVKNGELITPDLSSDILSGITRKTIIEIAKVEGLKVHERKVQISEIATMDEAFACGSSANIAPLLSIDNYILNEGKSGPITQKLRQLFATAQLESKEWTTSV